MTSSQTTTTAGSPLLGDDFLVLVNSLAGALGRIASRPDPHRLLGRRHHGPSTGRRRLCIWCALRDGWKWTGNFHHLGPDCRWHQRPNGALLARRPDHYENFTVVGVIVMALLMGLGGGMTRDVLINPVPAALTTPPTSR
jgi:Glycine transporter